MTTLDEIRNVLSSLAAIVGHHRELQGRVRLQKLGYLLQQRGFEPLAHVGFSYHYYGPYSDQLAGAVEQTVASRLIREIEVKLGNGRKTFNYELNKGHPDNEYLRLSEADEREVATFIALTKDEHYRTLELAATILYLERNLSVPRSEAVSRALGLKPDCADYQVRARALLSKLGFVDGDERN